MASSIRVNYPKLASTIDIDHLYDEDGCRTIGYLVLGHWDKKSVAQAINKAYNLKLKPENFTFIYIRTLFTDSPIADKEILFTHPKDERAIAATYCEL